MSAPVLIAAGGTGGHVVPALAVANVLRGRGIPVVWAGTLNGLEARLVPAAGIALHPIDVRGLRGQSLRATLTGPLRLVRACVQSIRLVRRLQPRAVLGMGGFVSGPVALAALALRVPLILHEQNAVPGMTNRRLARYARRVFAAFDGAFDATIGAQTVGNPVSGSMTPSPVPSSPADGISSEPLRVLVVGGSRGAERLNVLLPEALAHRRAIRASARALQVRHQAGAGRGAATRERYANGASDAVVDAVADAVVDSVTVEDFIDDMAAAYDTVDLVICRSGAMTVTELAARGRAALLVPYPHSVDDHQDANAHWLADAGAALVLPESTLDAATLAAAIDRLDGDRDALVAMSLAARSRFRPGAAETVADALLEESAGTRASAPSSGPDDVRMEEH